MLIKTEQIGSFLTGQARVSMALSTTTGEFTVVSRLPPGIDIGADRYAFQSRQAADSKYCQLVKRAKRYCPG